jgi:hypothetical protein
MSHGQPVVACMLALMTALVSANRCRGQAAWEYTPYEVRVRVALESSPQLPTAALPSLAEHLANRSETVLGAIWHVETAAATAELYNLLLNETNELTAEKIVAALPTADLSADKIYFASIIYRDQRYQLSVRELDCRTRQLGPPLVRTAGGIESLPLAIWDALVDGFTPLARIEQVEASRVTARLRAAGLAPGPESPALVQAGSALRPIVRRNDRGGQPAKGGIQSPPWTILTVNSREDALLDCTLQSGYRNPIPARGGVRVDRLALAIRPRYSNSA